eukprot:scaffold10345_cov103-Alexandrium_tamarense.AAC.1
MGERQGVCKLQADKFMSAVGNSNGERSGGMSVGSEINELECLVHEINLKRLVCVAAQYHQEYSLMAHIPVLARTGSCREVLCGVG